MKEASTIKDYIELYKTAKEIKCKHYSNCENGKKGVYFLLKKDEVVYVGMSKYSIEQRLYKHNLDKEYDYAKFIEINLKDDIDTAEYVFINIFNPIYNKKNKNNEY